MFTDPVIESPRRVLMFAEHCAKYEPTSRLRAELAGAEWYGWGRAERLLADNWDALWSTTFARAGVKDHEPPRYPRPGQQSQQPRGRTLSIAQVQQITGRR